jgi:REP element-mobilizing transposase RayT
MVTNQDIRRSTQWDSPQAFLRSLVAKDLFLEQLVRLPLRHECEILDFVVMENHVHLIIRPMGNSTLSGVMKFLLGVYTMGYNRI